MIDGKQRVFALKIISIHWGFSLGGVGKYATLIEDVSKYAPINIITLCILDKKWHSDISRLSKLNAKLIYIKSRADFSWIWRVAREIKNENPDLIMTHGFNGHIVAMTVKYLYKIRIPMICSYHGSYHAMTTTRKRFVKIFNLLTERFIRQIVISAVAVANFTRNYLIQKGIKGEKIEVIYNGIENKESNTLSRDLIRKEWGLNEEDILIGAISRLDPIKGITFLIDAFKKLSETIPTLRLVIIGSGILESELKKQIQLSQMVQKVYFTGYRADIDNCLSAIDIFVLPSLAENHSISLLEAMRARKPIIATDVGGNTESVRHEIEALIVPPQDSAALAQAIERLIQNPTLRDELGKRAYERFQNYFTADKMVQKTADWLVKCGELAKSNKQ